MRRTSLDPLSTSAASLAQRSLECFSSAASSWQELGRTTFQRVQRPAKALRALSPPAPPPPQGLAPPWAAAGSQERLALVPRKPPSPSPRAAPPPSWARRTHSRRRGRKRGPCQRLALHTAVHCPLDHRHARRKTFGSEGLVNWIAMMAERCLEHLGTRGHLPNRRFRGVGILFKARVACIYAFVQALQLMIR